MYAKVIDKHSRRASVPSVVCDERLNQLAEDNVI